MRISYSLIILPFALSCPDGFDNIAEKCYLKGDYMNREDAEADCKARGQDNHLWIIDSTEEFDHVIQHFGGRSGRSGARGLYWTDGILVDGVGQWASTGHPITFEPEMGTYPVCCSGMGCFGDAVSGDCLTVGRVSFGAADSGWGLLGCECQGNTQMAYICESPDTGSFDCPSNGQFASGPCQEMFWNCFDGIARPEFCKDGFVFNEKAGYCDYPENVEEC